MLMNKDKSALLIIDVQEKLTPLVLEHQAMVERCQWLMNLAETLNVPTVISEQYPSGLGPTLPVLQNKAYQTQCISKVHFSCMRDDACRMHLDQLEKTQLILAGIETHVCVLQTALDMKEAGYEVFVVVDAVSSRDQQDKTYALKRMKQAGIHLVTSEMVFFEWIRKAGTAEFKALSKAFL